MVMVPVRHGKRFGMVMPGKVQCYEDLGGGGDLRYGYVCSTGSYCV